MLISSHFLLAEVTKSDTALRLGINNSLPDVLLGAAKATAEAILEPCREQFSIPFSPNSWYRCEELERAICWGGDDIRSAFAKWCIKRGKMVDHLSWAEYFSIKQHPKGNAVDFEIPGVTNIDLAKWILNTLEFDQLILEFWDEQDPTAGWVHASFVAVDQNRREVLRMNGRGVWQGLP